MPSIDNLADRDDVPLDDVQRHTQERTTLPRLRKSKPFPGRLIRKPEVLDLTGYSYTTIWREEKARRFPKRVQLSPMAVGWFENEVLDWIQSRVRRGGKRLPVQYRGGPTKPKLDRRESEVAPQSQKG
jgi:prophage regulatory protein